MSTVTNFSDLVDQLVNRVERKKVAVVWAADSHTFEASVMALKAGFVDITYVGCQEQLEHREELREFEQHVRFVPASDPDDAAQKAVALVRSNEAQVLMKGLINTDNMLRAILNKETGILIKGNVLTHISVASIPTYRKLLVFSDAAVIPYPTQEQREKQVAYVSDLCHSFGIEEPRISLIHCTEKPNEKHFPFTVGYEVIIDKAKQGEYGKCIVDGPLDLKTSCDLESMKTKGIESPIAGDADAVIFPDIESGNIFYKSVTLFAGASTAGILKGAMAPVVISSRADSSLSKYYSLTVACMCK